MKAPPKFELLTHIAFNSAKEKRDILSRGLKEAQEGNIPAEALQRGKEYRKKIERGYKPKISIRFINKRIGYGVFAEQFFKTGCYVGEYTGVVRENVRVYFVPLNNYCYEYPIADRIGRHFVIDATKGNFTRFINHSNKPNLKPAYAFIDGFYHLILLSLRDIQKGEQISYEYGARYWYIRSPPEEL